MGQELFSNKFFTGPVTDLDSSSTLQRIAICGDNTVKILDIGHWKVVNQNEIVMILQTVADTFTLDTSYGKVDKMAWTKDGLILSVSTNQGYVCSFLTKVPLVSANYGIRYVHNSFFFVLTYCCTVVFEFS